MVVESKPILKSVLKIAAIGDIHEQWEAADALALEHLGIDLVLFVGDFGNEAVEIVEAIAQISLPKAAILGNHDAWYTASDWGRKKAPYDHHEEDRVQKQLDLLGKAHVGYGKLDFPEFNLSIVGGRPFSWGGTEWKNKDFYQDRYNIQNFPQSTNRIIEAAKSATCDHLIFLAHNGPVGLGEEAESPCGRDWQPLGGDFGDPDLGLAIAATQNLGKSIPLVTFGHMHHRLRHTQKIQRQAIATNPQGTIYFNCASVPRIIQTATQRLRNFCVVTLEDYQVTEVALVWLGTDFQQVSQHIFYSAIDHLDS